MRHGDIRLPENRDSRGLQVQIALIGFPSDENSSFLKGASRGPAAIREALFCESTNLWTESGLDLGAPGVLRDAGDVAPASGQFVEDLDAAISRLLDEGRCPIALGGDHAMTYPIVRAMARKHPGLGLFHLDAHPDLYDDFQSNPLSHASPFARIMEEGLVSRLVQAGVRSVNAHQRRQAERFGVEMIEMKDIAESPAIRFGGPVYVSVDMDALDPAFAPGVSHPEGGGLSTRQVIAMIQSVMGRIVGADVVELNPDRDVAGITAVASAKIVKELAGRILANL